MSETAGLIFPANIDDVLAGLQQARLEWRAAHDRHAELGVHFPSRSALDRILKDLISALFPLRFGPPALTASNENAYVGGTLETTLDQLASQLIIEFDIPDIAGKQKSAADQAISIVTALAADLPTVRRNLDADINAAYRVDPAASSVDEVLLSYPSIVAIIYHRVAHSLYRHGSRIVARSIGEIAHQLTGIDIHPGAEIGPGLFIDHGTGVVIGETAIVGSDLHIHQAVSIGGIGHDRSKRRHASIGDRVVLFPGAVLLGPIDVGSDSIIEANVVLCQSVPSGAIVRAPVPDVVFNDRSAAVTGRVVTASPRSG